MQFDWLKRREFITLIGGAAAAWPLAARAQQPTMPVVGFLNSLGSDDRPNLRDAFRRGLGEAGFVPGSNVAIEYRYADNQVDRLPALAADLVNRRVAVIAATGGGASVLAAKGATSAIPIVFVSAGDPVQEGYVASLNRPGGNLTGIIWFGTLLSGKGLGLLCELVPKATLIALLVNPNTPESARTPHDLLEATRTLGRQLLVLNASSRSEIDKAFATIRQQRADALLVSGDPFLSSRRQQIVTLAGRDAIPAMYFNREFVADGGLMSYGNDIADAYRRAGLYVGRILKGEKPAELPVDQATKFEFVINLGTAKALGLEVPPALSARADEIIE
jgi:putative ABC transport system substrate-binding protein